MLPAAPPDRLIDWTGERCVPWAEDRQVIYEHLHRYIFAAGLASGMRVLDLGSGEGYGAATLAEVAGWVTGVEIDAASVEHAKRRYRAENLEFRCETVLDLDDLEDESYDMVVCFEMIEHIAEHDRLVSTARRVLRPGGLFFVSTPDREIYSEASDYHNPYHVKELSRQEFAELLGGYFQHVAMWTQSVVVGSILRSLDQGVSGLDHGDGVNMTEDGRWMRQPLPAAPYLLAAASASPLPAVPAVSVLHHTAALSELTSGPAASPPIGDPLYELWDVDRLRRQVAIYESAMAEEVAARRRAELDLTVQQQRSVDERADFDRWIVEHREAIEFRDSEVQRLAARLDELEGSRAWRAVSRYRHLLELSRAKRWGSRNQR